MSNASVRRLLKLGRGGHDGGIVWLERARACFAAGRSAEGREAARRALAESPRDTSLFLAVADLLEQAGLGGDAMAIHRALVALPSPPGAAVIRVAEELLAQSQEEPALALLGRAVAAQQDDVDLRLAYALAFERIGRLVESLEQATVVCRLAGGEVEGHRLAARLYARLGRHANAVDAARVVVARGPADDLAAATDLGIYLSRAGAHDEAARVLGDVASRENTAAAHANLGMALLDAQRPRAALAAFTDAIARDAGSVQARLGAGLVHLSLRKPSEAVEELSIAAQLAPASEAAWYNLALAQQALGARAEARRSAFKAVRLAPDDDEIVRLLDELADAQNARGQISGDLTTFPLPDLIEFMRNGSKTGSVVITSTRGDGIVRLFEGRITSARAPRMARLGGLLVNRGLLDSLVLDDLLRQQRAQDGQEEPEQLGALILRHKLIPLDVLRGVMLGQIKEALAEIIGWREGTFSFLRRVERPDERAAQAIAFDAHLVMMELMQFMDERERRRDGAAGESVQ